MSVVQINERSLHIILLVSEGMK